jgi:glycosyltransferase involved in cell wall biosynthesis
MACGTPVVTSNVSSLPEVGGKAAVLVDPQSVTSIRAGILTASTNRQERIKRGLNQAKKFTWNQAAKQVLEVYEKIANRY